MYLDYTVYFRERELNLRSPGIQVQVMGVLVSIMGALVAEFYKGPLVRPSSHHLRQTKKLLVFSSTPEFWLLGGALLAAASFSLSISNFIQVYFFSFLYPFNVLFLKSCFTYE